MRQQIDLLTSSQLLGKGVFLYTVAEFIFFPIEIVLIMDDVVFTNGVYLSHLPNGLSSICEYGNDKRVSPKEGQQPKQCENCREDGKEERSFTLKDCIDPIDNPAGKDHHKKVLCQIIC